MHLRILCYLLNDIWVLQIMKYADFISQVGPYHRFIAITDTIGKYVNEQFGIISNKKILHKLSETFPSLYPLLSIQHQRQISRKEYKLLLRILKTNSFKGMIDKTLKFGHPQQNFPLR